jgi:hypothetical protein
MGSELGEEIAEISGAQDKFNIRAAEEGLDETELKVSRERGDGSHADDLLPTGAPVSEDLHHLFASAENGFSVFESDSSGFVQHQRFTLPFEERLPEALLEAAELGAEGGLGEVKPSRRSG